MAKPTKNILTRESVEKELRLLNRKDRRSFVFFFGISIFSLSLATGVALLLRLTVHTLIVVFVWCFVASPSLLLASVVFHALSEGRLLKKGCFEVSILPLSYKQEVSAHGHLEQQLVFRDFQPFAAGPTVSLLTDAGDEFYIVHYTGKKEIKLVYPLSMYDYKDVSP